MFRVLPKVAPSLANPLPSSLYLPARPRVGRRIFASSRKIRTYENPTFPAGIVGIRPRELSATPPRRRRVRQHENSSYAASIDDEFPRDSAASVRWGQITARLLPALSPAAREELSPTEQGEEPPRKLSICPMNGRPLHPPALRRIDPSRDQADRVPHDERDRERDRQALLHLRVADADAD